MGKKKSKKGGEKSNSNNSDGGGKKTEGEKSNSPNSDGGGKKDESVLTTILKVDMHCEGCATKIKKSVRSLEGVEAVKVGDGKLMVIGKVDPAKVREVVEQKVKKKVELVSPQPKKEKEKEGAGGVGEKKSGGNPEKKPDDKKPKEPPVTTAVMKVSLHCNGCIQKIRKTVTKTKGYHEMSMDEEKNLVTVKGSMDMKALAESLSEKLKKPVEIVPPKKDDGEKKKGGGGGSGKKERGDDGGGNSSCQAAEENMMQYAMYGYPNPPMLGYGMGYPIEHPHAPQIFSDENPNACSVM